MKSTIPISILIRAFLLIYSDYQDKNFAVKFTDIDYFVFTDAAKFISGNESPYNRATYRYTPLLAMSLLPAVSPIPYITTTALPYFGKLLFVVCDLITGILIRKILILRGVEPNRSDFYSRIWLYNPFVAVISCRGNAESILSAMCLGVLYLLMKGRVGLAAFVFGLSVHFKLYPVTYTLPIMLYLETDGSRNAKDNNVNGFWKVLTEIKRWLNYKRMQFALISFSTFIILSLSMYNMYGKEYLSESWLYHLSRKDHRHNFSIYHYQIYLTFQNKTSLVTSLAAFLPQIILVFAIGFACFRDLSFCMFAQTLAFVMANKVVTSQYFMWYLCYLPLILPFSRLTERSFSMRGVTILVLWVLAQALWLSFAYLLEHKGVNTFIYLWAAGVLFFGVNVWILIQFISANKW